MVASSISNSKAVLRASSKEREVLPLFDEGLENLGLRLAEGDLHCLFELSL